MGGIFNIFAIPLGWLLKFIYDFVGNYGVSLILFTLVTKIILFPLSWKQKKSSIKMAAFQPMMNDINKKYANDPQKRQEEIVRLQQENGISATAGCLPLLIQMPILFGLINVIYEPLRHLARIPVEAIDQAKEVVKGLGIELSRYSPQSTILTTVRSNPDAFKNIFEAEQIAFCQEINMSFLGIDLTAIPDIKHISILWIVPILSVVFMLAQQVVMTKLNGQKMEGIMRWMPIYMGVMFGYISFVIPTGVSIYWIFSSVFGILQEFVLRIFFDPDKEKAKVEEQMREARKKSKAAKNGKAIPDKDGKMTASQAELAKRRLEAARKAAQEKYGE